MYPDESEYISHWEGSVGIRQLKFRALPSGVMLTKCYACVCSHPTCHNAAKIVGYWLNSRWRRFCEKPPHLPWIVTITALKGEAELAASLGRLQTKLPIAGRLVSNVTIWRRGELMPFLQQFCHSESVGTARLLQSVSIGICTCTSDPSQDIKSGVEPTADGDVTDRHKPSCLICPAEFILHSCIHVDN